MSITDDDIKNVREFLDYISDDEATCGLAIEEMLWVIHEFRENPNVKLMDALSSAQDEWSNK